MSAPTTDAVLELDQLTRRFGGLTAVDSVDLTVTRGEIHGLIGPNGSGKSTLLNLVSGIYRVSEGRISLGDQEITRTSAAVRTRHGVARTFQNIRLFANLRVIDNVAVARFSRSRAGLASVLLRTPGMRAEERDIQQRAHDALELVGLTERAQDYPGDLPYGQRRLVEIARALATEPSVLLLDEPAAGLTSTEKTQLLDVIRTLNTERELTLLLVEHDMNLIMNVCDRITVLNFGARIGEGTAAEVRKNPAVIEAYLGRGHDDA